jgi:hypothetical protein
MKTTKIFVFAAIVTATIALAGCVQAPAVSATSTSTATDEVTETPAVEVPAPVVVDPVEEAQISSGLTAEQYVAATAQMQDSVDMSKDEFNAMVDGMTAEFGKPVVLIAYYECPRAADAGVYSWGIAGALSSPSPQCGVYPEQLSREGAIGAAEKRAERSKNTLDDYIVLFADYS